MSKILGFTLVFMFAGMVSFAQTANSSKTCSQSTSKTCSKVCTSKTSGKHVGMTSNAGVSEKKACSGHSVAKTSNAGTTGTKACSGSSKATTSNAGTTGKACTGNKTSCAKKMSNKTSCSSSGATKASFSNAGQAAVNETPHAATKHAKACCSTAELEKCAQKMGMTLEECKAACSGTTASKTGKAAE